jgi:D-alanyl-D-alanine carboxypeptidase
VAQASPAPALAGFSLPQVTSNQGGQYAALSPVPKQPQTEDEDAAEAVRAPDENLSVIHGEAPAVPKPAPAQAKPSVPVATVLPKGPVPSIRPTPRPEVLVAAVPAPVKVAANTPVVNAPRPQMRPSVREDVGEGDADPAPGRNWTIQIGAYADQALAKAQLDIYAGKAQDVLARTSHIIAPIQSASGHTLYRARFGLFAEREARDVCSRLTQRGQTCFAAIQTR